MIVLAICAVVIFTGVLAWAAMTGHWPVRKGPLDDWVVQDKDDAFGLDPRIDDPTLRDSRTDWRRA